MQTDRTVKNIDDYAVVCVCFHEHLISYLFADLLEARGVPTKIIRHPTEPCQVTRVITEPLYFDSLSILQQKNCLLVGTLESLAPYEDQGTYTLARPLSEEKIDAALNLLFERK